jgi:Putative phage serine protease XkdF
MSQVDLTVPLRKTDIEGVFTGVVTEPGLPDSDGDVFSPATIEKMCHRFMQSYALAKAEHSPDVNHSGRDADADLLENWIAPCPLTVAGQPVRQGAWIQTWKVNDPIVKAEIAEGKLTGLSLEGVGSRRPIGGSNAQ